MASVALRGTGAHVPIPREEAVWNDVGGALSATVPLASTGGPLANSDKRSAFASSSARAQRYGYMDCATLRYTSHGMRGDDKSAQEKELAQASRTARHVEADVPARLLRLSTTALPRLLHAQQPGLQRVPCNHST